MLGAVGQRDVAWGTYERKLAKLLMVWLDKPIYAGPNFNLYCCLPLLVKQKCHRSGGRKNLKGK